MAGMRMPMLFSKLILSACQPHPFIRREPTQWLYLQQQIIEQLWGDPQTKIGENRQLVTNEPVELEK